MNHDQDTARIVRLWLREDLHENAETVLEAISELVEVTPQRRRFRLARMIAPMSTRFVLAAAVAVVVIAALAITLPTLPSASSSGVASGAPTTSPSESLAPSPSLEAPAPSMSGAALGAGRYGYHVGKGSRAFLVDLTLPPGWVETDVRPSSVSLAGSPGGSAPTLLIASVLRVYKDPCHPSLGFQGGYLGHANATDLEAELTNLSGFTASTPTTILAGSRSLRHFSIMNAINTQAAACDDRPTLRLFSTDDAADRSTEPQSRDFSPGTRGGTTQDIWIADRVGWGLLIVAQARESNASEDLAVIQQILNSSYIR